MEKMNEIVKLAVDNYHGKVEKYSTDEANKTLRNALIEANGGDTAINLKKLRRGNNDELFSIIEEILSNTVIEGFQGDEFFNALVDFRNVAEGDKNEFVVDDNTLFVVSDVADGTQAIRRQRLGGSTRTSISTTFKMVRIYEELNRILSGRVDFNTMIDNVGRSFRQKLLSDIYALWSEVTSAQLGGDTYLKGGNYNEDTLLDLVSHVEAAAGGKQATVVGTKKALRNLKDSIISDGAKEELYNMGYAGKFYGTPVVCVPQRHQIGSTNFVLPDNVLTVVAGDDKPIKVVYEGDPMVIMGDPTLNADLTQEYVYAEKWGCGIVLAGGNAGVGKYTIGS